MGRKKSKKQSLRLKMVFLNMAITLAALTLCGLVFAVSVWLLMGKYVKHDVDFFLTETAANVQTRVSYLEDIIYRLRDSDTVMEGSGMGERMNTAFANAVDISSPKNTGSDNSPLIPSAYLFRQDKHCSTFYYAMLYSQAAESDRKFQEIYQKFRQSGEEDYQYFQKGEELYLAFTLYDDDMKDQGTLIFALDPNVFAGIAGNMTNYEESFWILWDQRGNRLAGNNTEILDAAESQILETWEYSPYLQKIQREDYRIYATVLPMELRLGLGVPENQIFKALLRSMKIPLLLILLLTITAAVAAVYVINREYEKQLAAKEMELKFIQTQMNPHFMFNVLNTIALKAKMSKNEEIFKMLTSFTHLIQAKIYRADTEKVKIRQELEYVDYYLYLQSYRYGERLSYELEAEEDALLELYLPKLSIQLLVENAVVHGLEPLARKGKVQVLIYGKNEDVFIDVIDNGIGFDTDGEITLPLKERGSEEGHNHVGLNNVHHMIQLMYGENYGLHVLSEKGGGTVVSIHIPQDREES